MADPIIIAKAVALLTDKKKRKWLLYVALFLVAIPILLLLIIATIVLAIFSLLTPTGDALVNDVYHQAISSIKANYSINNDLPVYVVKAVDMVHTGDIRQTREDAALFVKQYFVDSQEVVVSVDEEGNEETETVCFFRTATEMLEVVARPPFSFSPKDIMSIQNMYLVAGGTKVDQDQFAGTYPMPTKGYITSGYGNRVDPLNGNYFEHPALDIQPAWHSNIISIAGGTVVRVWTDSIYGNNVTIRHDHGSNTFYSFSAHLSKVMVREGQQVVQGQVIGLEGGDPTLDPNPGRTTGHHLHFEIWLGPTRKDHANPLQFLKR